MACWLCIDGSASVRDAEVALVEKHLCGAHPECPIPLVVASSDISARRAVGPSGSTGSRRSRSHPRCTLTGSSGASATRSRAASRHGRVDSLRAFNLALGMCSKKPRT